MILNDKIMVALTEVDAKQIVEFINKAIPNTPPTEAAMHLCNQLSLELKSRRIKQLKNFKDLLIEELKAIDDENIVKNMTKAKIYEGLKDNEKTLSDELFCASCTQPVIQILKDVGGLTPMGSNWWIHCSNKNCENFEGECDWPHTPKWVKKH
jgi:hypothetical protein